MALAVLALAGVAVLGVPAVASAEWVRVTPETPSSKGWYEDPSTGNRQLWDKAGKLVKEWSPEEWKSWKGEIDAYASGAAENDQKISNLAQDMVNNTASGTGGSVSESAATDAATVLTKAREAGPSLDSEVTQGLDLMSEQGGALDAGVFADSAVAAPLALGAAAFTVGWGIGSGIYQLFQIPKEEWPYTEPEGTTKITSPNPENCKLIVAEAMPSGLSEIEGNEWHPAHFVENGGLGIYTEGKYSSYSGENLLVKDPEGKTVTNTAWACGPVGESSMIKYTIKEGYGAGDKVVRTVWAAGFVCAVSTVFATECAKPIGKAQLEMPAVYKQGELPGNHPVIQGVPQVGLTPSQEAENKAHGLPSKPQLPKTYAHPHAKPKLRDQQYEELTPGPGFQPDETVKEPANKEAEHTEPDFTESPQLKYWNENAPLQKEAAKEAPSEASGKAGAPPEIPSIKFPEVETPCNKFPFGIPCWLVARLAEFATSERTPKFEPEIDGFKMVIDFGRADELMEIVRAVELVLGVITGVLLFGRFASSPTGSSAGSDD